MSKKKKKESYLFTDTGLNEDSKYGEIVNECNGVLLNCYGCRYKTLCFYIANSGTGSPYQYKENQMMRDKTIGELLNRTPAPILS